MVSAIYAVYRIVGLSLSKTPKYSISAYLQTHTRTRCRCRCCTTVGYGAELKLSLTATLNNTIDISGQQPRQPRKWSGEHGQSGNFYRYFTKGLGIDDG